MIMNTEAVNKFFYLTGEDQDPMTIYVFKYDQEEGTVYVLTDWEMEVYILSEEAFEDFIPADDKQISDFTESVRAIYASNASMEKQFVSSDKDFEQEELEKIKERSQILREWQAGAKILLENNIEA